MVAWSVFLYGYLAVVGACVAFGSFGVPTKSAAVAAAKVHPVAFQIYYSLAIFVSAWGVLLYNPFVFTWFGFAGAAIWTPSSILALAAISDAGLSVAQTVWSGTTIMISFLWGALAYHDKVSSLPLAMVALATLLCGLVLLASLHSSLMAGVHAWLGFAVDDESLRPHRPGDVRAAAPLVAAEAPAVNVSGGRGLDDAYASAGGGDGKPLAKLVRGVVFALVLGVLNGSLMVPLRETPKRASGINYIISFSIGVVSITPLLALGYMAIMRAPLQLHWRVALGPGLLTGLLWQIGNYCSIYATLYLGLTIGYPLTQLALLVAGLWGWLYYGELPQARHVAHFWLAAIVVLGGAALLAIAG
ncbi:uncharacterized protein AMSG_09158 [Thecamonas trahens ATCC 50062]|uniref:Uncharacterized protein n=1 Tax=Thecamonas trahens ATCC 50062 TaxID=461836 RepID=A0A0L0DKY9_THETB|nr:hypothetical protein AMSG_09158 [Thecamonas trahens ATCC 50062]KNC52982.1 hypothetical protein AMSG_09158 [Thecamonas trahens ATCC 50062]|eukprot:XP_013754871.1 hypothetical protein AMSG_09158 [Thecamonas trahens ATCC 50062]